MQTSTTGKAAHSQKMESYYSFQAKIYDTTRWSFLFGRKRLIRELPFSTDEAFQILEVGCGTGANLFGMAKRFPKAQLTGVDVSSDMLKRSAKKMIPFKDRVKLLSGYYGQVPIEEQPDLIVFSYCLTMVNPGWDKLVEQAKQDLKPGGFLALADFHDSKVTAFKRHMG
ncbi:MAG: methyltransferase domain-containing protein, partial [Bacteroidota bacterium]